MQILKPVDQLLCTIHSVFPPMFGVAPHKYFTGWTIVSHSDLLSSSSLPSLSSFGGSIDDNKMKKIVRKCRFFLHPDKLPHDLTDDQRFMCSLLWDIINDSYAEFKKTKDDLDWM
mmetsp:Transcript_44522/g.45161  ORF Transcript_44522/g.45161 Transcript_44522/m.45161 type:complete len:115 (-) Transcript_44522:161-505(-)